MARHQWDPSFTYSSYSTFAIAPIVFEFVFTFREQMDKIYKIIDPKLQIICV